MRRTHLRQLFARVAPAGSCILLSWTFAGRQRPASALSTVEHQAQTIDSPQLEPVSSSPRSVPSATGVLTASNAPGSTLTLALVGDVLPIGVDNPFQDTQVGTLLRGADLTFANLETPLSTRGQPTPLKFHDGARRKRLISNEFLFRAVPFRAQGLRHGGIDVVSLANNHSMDYGAIAIRDTFIALKRNGIAYVGAGGNLSAARHPAIQTRHGVRVAFLAYIQDGDKMLPGTRYFAASARQPGMAFIRKLPNGDPAPQDLQMVRADVAAARAQADVVAVSYHWGIERHTRPTSFQRRLGRLSIEAGADLVVGQHPHCLQGVEVYRGKPIFYSLGNFVFRSFDSLTRRTGIALLTVGKSGVQRVIFYPAYIRRVRPYTQPTRAQTTLVRWQRRSRELGAPVGIAKQNGSSVAYLNLTPPRQSAVPIFQPALFSIAPAPAPVPAHAPSDRDFVDVARAVPNVSIDLPYATTHNAFNTKFYPVERAFLRRGTARKLRRAAEILARSGLRLKVWDAYRPLPVQRRMWAVVHDRRYIANPARSGSNHNRGTAVDVTLIDRQGHELPMPTGFDDFSRRAHVSYRSPSRSVRRNVWLLRSAMTRAGFRPLSTEWWHFNDTRAKGYSLSSVTLQVLAAQN